VTLLVFAAERRAAALLLLGAQQPSVSIDTSYLHGAQQQTRRTPQLGRMRRQTDRTDEQKGRFILQ